jgi:hypothetical protein
VCFAIQTGIAFVAFSAIYLPVRYVLWLWGLVQS